MACKVSDCADDVELYIKVVGRIRRYEECLVQKHKSHVRKACSHFTAKPQFSSSSIAIIPYIYQRVRMCMCACLYVCGFL